MIMATSSLPIADLIVIGGFFAVMLGIGFYYAGRMCDMKDYFAAGKCVPWWLSSISLWMTSFSAFAFVAHSALAYRHGLVPVTLWWSSAAMMIITAHLVAARWRRVAVTSPMEFIEQRYGPFTRQSLSWLGALLILLDDATKTLAIGLLVSASFGLDTTAAILCCGAIMLSYTMLGGLWAVLITDAVQFIIMLAAVVVLIPLAIAKAGGPAVLVESLAQKQLVFMGGKYTGAYLAVFALLTLLTYCTRWSLVSRFYTVPTDFDARKVCYLVAALNLFVAPFFLLPALAATVFLPGIENVDQVYGLLCRELLPVGLFGMLIAGMFSATMSSLAGDYNAVAAVFTTDVYKRLFVRSGTNRHYLLVGRIFTLAIGIVTICMALALLKLHESLLLFDIMVAIFVVLGPPTSIPVIAGLLTTRVSTAGALCGILGGIGVNLIARFFGVQIFNSVIFGLEPLGDHFIVIEQIPETVFMLVSGIATIAGLVIGSFLFPGNDDYRSRVRSFLDGLVSEEDASKAGQPPVLSSQRVNLSPLSLIGVAISFIGLLLLVALLTTAPLKEATWGLVVGSILFVLGAGMAVMPRFISPNSE